MATFPEFTENECIIQRHLRIINSSLIYVGVFSKSESHSTLLSVDMIEMGLLALYGFSLSVRPSVCLSVTLVIHA